MSPRVDELGAELVALHRHNEQLSQLAGQAIRMGEKLLYPARETVSAYYDYARLAAASEETAKPAARRLADAVDKLSRPLGDSKLPRRDRRRSAPRK
jgi:hypothetical protein